MHFVCSNLNKVTLHHLVKKDHTINHMTAKEVLKTWGLAIRVQFDASNASITMRKEEAVGPAGTQ